MSQGQRVGRCRYPNHTGPGRLLRPSLELQHDHKIGSTALLGPCQPEYPKNKNMYLYFQGRDLQK